MLVFDTEISNKGDLLDIGAVTKKGLEFHSKSITGFIKFIKKNKPRFLAGHNIINFDLVYLKKYPLSTYLPHDKAIDTLFLSALLFPKKPYHHLVKDDKILSDYINNPLNDAKKALFLLDDSVNQFHKLDKDFKSILYNLLKDSEGFKGFFSYLKYRDKVKDLKTLIKKRFQDDLCYSANLDDFILNNPIELSYALSYINTNDTNNSLVSAWVLMAFPKVEEILLELRNAPCKDETCIYCRKNLSGIDGLKRYFNYQTFREFDGVNLQEEAVNHALDNESLIAVFPTGGGKSLTFQLPALMAGENIGGLTVVISPLQSLMKDQVDNLNKKGIIKADFINGLLNSIEKKDVIERVLDGSVSLLYLSPESLRSRTVKNLLLKRQIVRFVIDEAHCFSSWGHDFRVDYLYIADFIKLLCAEKGLKKPFPVSCFTATAKHDVIEDIKNYFKEKLDLEMEVFKTTKGRTNLDYQVIKVDDDENRYIKLRTILETTKKPTIIYASRIKTVNTLHKNLLRDNFKVSKFHGKMESDEKIKNQNQFMANESDIIVATSAFGMGVDKEDVGVIIHYHISSSLEDYFQESGRAGRDFLKRANCYILYNIDDLDNHFNLLNYSKVSIKEISQIWSGIKDKTKNSDTVYKSALEIANAAGWPEAMDGSSTPLETKVMTSVATLEQGKYLKRGLNYTRVFASSLLVGNMEEAARRIDKSNLSEDNKLISKRIISSLISRKYKDHQGLEESRVDYLADILGIEKRVVIENVNYLRELKLLEDDNDMYAKINVETKLPTLITNLNKYKEAIFYLLSNFEETRKAFNLKQLNEDFKDSKYVPVLKNLRNALNYLEQMNFVKVEKTYRENFYAKLLLDKKEINKTINKRLRIAEFVINYLFDKYHHNNNLKTDYFIDFSVVELKKEYLKQLGLIKEKIILKDIGAAILLLQRLGILAFDGGFLVTYSPLSITRLIKDNKKRFLIKDYEKLADHYKNKNQQIHIVGRYAELMSEDEKEANLFVSDYFNLKYQDFLDKHFPGEMRKALDQKMSQKRFEKLFGNLSEEQQEIINDANSKTIGVTAGPGSGKTTLLVHKLASIIYLEDIRTEQLLMLTFSRNAAIEFKERLRELIGNVANYINITTFHSFAFDVLGKPGSLEHANEVIKDALALLRNNEADKFKITKMMLVIDEAQDISEEEYQFIIELINSNDNLRVMAVGDDDQNIFEFRGSNSKYLKEFSEKQRYELSINFRSKTNIVNYTNKIIALNKERLKTKEIKSFTKKAGKVIINTYLPSSLIKPIVDKVVLDLTTKNISGKTAIITKTNEEALLVSGLLTEYKVFNKLIQEMKDVNTFNIYEIRKFYEVLNEKTISKIDLNVWDSLINFFKLTYQTSSNFELYMSVFSKFIEVYNEPYLTDFKEFLLETDLAFFNKEHNLIVANIHKVKGMEFDNVYLLYDDTSYLEDDKIRELYVALTRAKKHLEVHTTNKLFRSIKVDNVIYHDVFTRFEEPEVIELAFSLQDVNLGYYSFVKNNLKGILSGDKLTLEEDILIYQNKKVGRLSKRAVKVIAERIARGYFLEDLEVLNLVYWYNKEKEEEELILLPKLKFRLNNKSKKNIEK